MQIQKGQSSPPLFTRTTRKALIWLLGISIVINLLMLTGPLFMIQVYDRVLSSGSVPTLLVLLGLTLLLYCAYGLFETLRARILTRLSLFFEQENSHDCFIQSFGQQPRNTSSSDRLDASLRKIRAFLSGAGPAALFDLPWTPLYLGLLFLFNPLLGSIATLGTLLIGTLAWLSEFSLKSKHHATARSNKHSSQFSQACQQSKEAIIAMSMQAHLSQHAKDEEAKNQIAFQQIKDRQTGASSLIKTLRLMMQSGILAAGAWLAINQQISAGTIIAASIVTARAMSPIEQLLAHWPALQVAQTGFRHINKSLNQAAHQTPTSPHLVGLTKDGQGLQVQDLVCRLPGNANFTLQGFNFDLPKGKSLGLIGPSGAGKSSFIQALLGNHPLAHGAVFINGASIRHWPAEARSQLIGYLPQSLQLLPGTIAQNIARFQNSANDSDIHQAALSVCAHDKIAALEVGYDTQISSSSPHLSPGIAQRIGLARALFGSPSLIILDSPETYLDQEGKLALYTALSDHLKRSASVILISQDVTLLHQCDSLLYLQQGRPKLMGPQNQVLNHLQQTHQQKSRSHA